MRRDYLNNPPPRRSGARRRYWLIPAVVIVLAGAAGLFWPMPTPKSPDPVKPPATKAAIVGEAEAIDGDSLRIEGIEVRLEGVDAFEYDQRCGTFACGTAAGDNLRKLVSAGDVSCEPQGEDRYGRILAHCAVDGRDLGATQVQAGLAVAYRRYSQRYVADEASAKAAKRGAWAHGFEAPEDFRHGQ